MRGQSGRTVRVERQSKPSVRNVYRVVGPDGTASLHNLRSNGLEWAEVSVSVTQYASGRDDRSVRVTEWPFHLKQGVCKTFRVAVPDEWGVRASYRVFVPHGTLGRQEFPTGQIHEMGWAEALFLPKTGRKSPQNCSKY